MKFGFINLSGAVIVALLMIPNIVYAFLRRGEKNACTSRFLNTMEQVGCYACIILMWLPLLVHKFGFASVPEMMLYYAGNSLLLAAYWFVFARYLFRGKNRRRTRILAVLPACIFLLSGILLRHWLLAVAAVLFAVVHSYVTGKNERAFPSKADGTGGTNVKEAENVFPDDAVSIRRFEEGDAEEVSALVIRTLRTVSIRDYSEAYIEDLVQRMQPPDMRKRAEWTHFYVACHSGRIVGCGAIGPYWDRVNESCLFTFFVLPEYEGRGIGRRIMDALEKDEFFLRAERIEIPASITAVPFYLKMGYGYRDGVREPDADGLVRLEKHRNV